MLTKDERTRRLAALVEWATTDEAHAEIAEAVDLARKDAEIFLRMDQIERDVHDVLMCPADVLLCPANRR